MSISTLLYGVFNPLLKKAGLNLYATLIVQLGLSWLVALPIFFWTGSVYTITVNSVIILAVAAVIGSIVYLFTISSFPLLPMWQIAMFNLLLPIIVAIVSYFLLGEAISPKMFVALGIMLVGMVVAFV